MRQLVGSLLLFTMVALQAPVFANANGAFSCSSIYSEEASPTAGRSLNIIESYLQEKGFSFQDPAKQSWIGRLRSKALFAKLELGHLSIPRYRDWWVEKMIDLELSRKIDLLSDYELSLKPQERKKINRLLLRSLINQGLRNDSFSVYSENPKNFPDLLKRTVQIIRFNPIFRFVVLWDLPQKKINFTDEQIEVLLTKGVSALTTDPVLRSVVDQNRSAVTKAQWILWARTVLKVGWLTMSFIHTYPEVEKAVLEAQDQQLQQATRVIEQSKIDADGMILDLASSQLRDLFQAYETKYGTKPTEDEKKLLEEHVCRNRYGEALSDTGIAQCLLIF